MKAPIMFKRKREWCNKLKLKNLKGIFVLLARTDGVSVTTWRPFNKPPGQFEYITKPNLRIGVSHTAQTIFAFYFCEFWQHNIPQLLRNISIIRLSYPLASLQLHAKCN
jgi:hypothetical protein